MPERFRAPIAVHLLLVRDEQILLLRRCNTGYADGQYSVPAGHLDGGEPVVDAMRREAREEIGVELRSDDARVVGVMHRWEGNERIDFFLTSTHWQGEPRNLEPDKCDDLRWFPLHALPGNVVPYVRRGIENYQSGQAFDAYGWE